MLWRLWKKTCASEWETMGSAYRWLMQAIACLPLPLARLGDVGEGLAATSTSFGTILSCGYLQDTSPKKILPDTKLKKNLTRRPKKRILLVVGKEKKRKKRKKIQKKKI